MGVILKHTFRNIFAKPLMTLFLVVSITICSFAGMMAFDMNNSIKNILRGAFGSMYGTSNVLVSSNTDISEEDIAGLPENEATFISTKDSKLTVRNDQMYAYYNQKNLETVGVDTKIASDMKLIPKGVELGENECIITKTMAKELKLSEGDTFTIYGDNYVSQDYKIKKVAPLSGLLENEYTAVVSKEGMSKLCYDGKVKYQIAYIKVSDEASLSQFCNQLEDRVPNAVVENLVSGKTVEEQVSMISGIFKMLFLVTLLLVIFVTVNLSERIMIDRMSTVGTLRSLGVSPGLTSRVILVENMFYGLFGGVIGTGLYVLTRDTIFNNVFTVSSGSDVELSMDLGKVSIPVMIAVILGAVIVEMLCPLKELHKATNTAIRDIIFDNKDTEYKYIKKKFVISIICGSLGMVLAVLSFTVYKDNALVSVLGFILLILSFVSGYSFILRGISGLFEKLGQRRCNVGLTLAAINLRTKKTSIGSSKLAFIATTLSLVLFIAAISFYRFATSAPADANVILKDLSENAETYDYIKDLEGVTNIEFEYSKHGSIVVGTEKIEKYLAGKYEKRSDEELTNASFLGTDGRFSLITSYKGLPEKVNDGEIYIGGNLARELDVKIGDSIDLLLNPDGVVPYRDTFKVAGIINSSIADGSNNTIAMPLELYKQIYFDKPSYAYINSDNPEETVSLIKSYSSSTVSKIRTMADYIEEQDQQSAGMMTILYMIIIMGVGLSLVGVFSNQIVGFESRKRECAVLISTAMGRTSLIKMFAVENLLSSGISIVLGTVVGLVSTVLFFNAMKAMMPFDMVIDYGKTVAFLAIMFITFSITILKTMKNIKKMKISEQLKYE